MKRINYSFLLIVGTLSLLSVSMMSCNRDIVYEQYLKLTNDEWKTEAKAFFEIDVEDTISSHSLFINVRNTSKYPYQNLFLFIDTYNPEGRSIRDTIECILADDKGKWTGSGIGDHLENDFPFKRNVRFPESGKYRIEIEQAMRSNPLSGISEIGVRLEKVH